MLECGYNIPIFGMADICAQRTQTGRRCLDIPVGGRAVKMGGSVGKGGADQQAMSLGFGRDGTDSAAQFAGMKGKVHIRGLS